MVFFQVHDDGHGSIFKFKQLVGFGITQSVDTRNAIANGKDSANFVKVLPVADLLKLLEQYL